MIRPQVYSQIEGTGVPQRNQLRRKLVIALREHVEKLHSLSEKKGKVPDADKRWAAECAIRLEEALHAAFRQGKSYSERARSLLFNLSDPRNPDLKQRILSQELSARDVVMADSSKLASKELIQEREEARHKIMQGARTDLENEITLQDRGGQFSGLFSCEECGSKKTGYVQYQIDRADEPMTNFVFCYDCHHRWKC